MYCNTVWQRFYGGSVEARRLEGYALYRRLAGIVALDRQFKALFGQLDHHTRLLDDAMATLQLGRLCGRCGSQEGGGCCSLEMAGETDGVQVCLNLLAGVQVRVVRSDGLECCYLGPRGCLFRFKPMFCLNYLCSHIRTALAPAELGALESHTGAALGCHYLVESRLLELLAAG